MTNTDGFPTRTRPGPDEEYPDSPVVNQKQGRKGPPEDEDYPDSPVVGPQDKAKRPKRGFFDNVGRWFSGQGDTEFPYPELPGVSYKGRPLNWMMAAGLSDDERAFIARNTTGKNFTILKDKFGNAYIQVGEDSGIKRDGQSLPAGGYYLDKPGLTPQTWRTAAANLGISALPMAWGARGIQGAGLGARALRGAAVGTVSEAAREGIVSKLANKQLFHPELILTAGLAGGGAEAVLGPLVNWIGRSAAQSKLVRRFVAYPEYYDPKTGRWTPKGEKLLKESGVVEDAPTQGAAPKTAGTGTEVADAAADEAGAGVAGVAGGKLSMEQADKLGLEFLKQLQVIKDPKAALRAAQSTALPVPFKQRISKTAQDARLGAAENLASQGHLGGPAANAIRAQQQIENQALVENQGALIRKVTGNPLESTIIDEGGVGSQWARGNYMKRAQDSLIQKRAAQSARVDELYSAAKKAGDVELSPKVLSAGKTEIGLALRDAGYSPTASGPVVQVLEQFDQPLTELEKRLGLNQSHNLTSTVNRVFNIRQQLSEMQRNMAVSNPGASSAAGFAKRQLDRWVGEKMAWDISLGSRGGVEAWRKAIRSRADFAKMWEDVDIIDELSALGPDGLPKYDPQDIANIILGYSTRIMTNKRELTRQMARLKDTLSAQEWNNVRGEVLARIFMRGIVDLSSGSPYTVSGAKILTDWNQLRFENPTLLKTLFTADEIRLITRYAQVAARTTGHQPGSYNASNTAAVSALLGRLYKGLDELALGVPGKVKNAIINPLSTSNPNASNEMVRWVGGEWGRYGNAGPLQGLTGALAGYGAANYTEGRIPVDPYGWYPVENPQPGRGREEPIPKPDIEKLPGIPKGRGRN